MKEQVRTTKHPWLVGVAVAGIAAAYFMLLGTSEHPEPGENLLYDVKVYEELDRIPTRYQEDAAIALPVADARAVAAHGGDLYVVGPDAGVVLTESGQERLRFSFEGIPNCVGVAPDKSILVGLKDQVIVLDSEGAPRSRWTPLTGQAYITSIAARDGNVYVGDAGNRVVLRYDSAGNLLGQLGLKDESRDIPGLEVPSPYLDLAINPDGDLWVANPGKLGLERYREDGEIVTSWYHPTLELSGFSGCCNPTQIAFAPEGDLITCEKGIVRVKRYDVTSGEFIELIAGSALFPRQQSMRDLAVDSAGRILVLDPKANALRVFTMKGNPDETTA